MTPDVAEALGLEFRPDGGEAFIVLRDGAVEAWIDRCEKDSHQWRAVTVKGLLLKARTVSALLDDVASNLTPRPRR
jgi:hypothetical protein